jgi:NADH-quinone oxidoreductase subunit J
MVALAGLYLLMGAEFVFAMQVMVYGGAVMVLFVIVIMLLNAGIEEHTSISKLAGFPGILLVLALTGFVAVIVARSRGISVPGSASNGKLISGALTPMRDLLIRVFANYAYPFELTSFLILIAILGAIVLAHREH